MWPWVVRQWRYVGGGGGEDEPKKPFVVAMKEIVSCDIPQ